MNLMSIAGKLLIRTEAVTDSTIRTELGDILYLKFISSVC